MVVFDLGKHMDEHGFKLEDVSPKQLLSETMEGIREAMSAIEKPVDAILVGERVYRAMVDRLEEWVPSGDLVPHRPEVSFQGIRVYVVKDEEERFAMRWGLWEEGKKVLEVVE